MKKYISIISVCCLFPISIALAADQYLERADKAFEEGRFVEAIKHYSDALEFSELSAVDRAEVFRAKGLTFGRLQEDEKAVEAYRNAVALDPKNVAAISSLCFQYSRAEVLEKALSACNRALKIDPDHAPTINIRADIWKKKNEHDRAEADFLRSVELDPDNWAIKFNLANFYDDIGRNAAAKHYYERAFAAAPTWAHNHPLTQKSFKKYGLIK